MTNYIERYWRDATPQDAIKEPPMVARFRYEGDEDWEYNLLVGWDRTDECRWRSQLDSFNHCQVYDAPDPGEGWRLIDVNTDVPMQGDEMWTLGRWETRSPNFAFGKIFTYRRRIEQPKPEPKYVPFAWEDREQLRGRWIVRAGHENNEQMIHKLDFTSGHFYANNKDMLELLDSWRFLESNEPVGKKVTQ